VRIQYIQLLKLLIHKDIQGEQSLSSKQNSFTGRRLLLNAIFVNNRDRDTNEFFVALLEKFSVEYSKLEYIEHQLFAYIWTNDLVSLIVVIIQLIVVLVIYSVLNLTEIQCTRLKSKGNTTEKPQVKPKVNKTLEDLIDIYLGKSVINEFTSPG